MDNTLSILLPYGYHVDEADVKSGKNYIQRRESAARGLSSLIDSLLKDAAQAITLICYRYNVDPRTFQMTSTYNEDLFKEIAAVLDDLEDEIIDLTLDYSTRCTESEKRKAALLPWIVLLGKNNMNLRQTLEKRLWMFSRDLEAMIVAMRLAQYDSAKAVTRIKSSLHTVYVMPEMKAAFANASLFKAMYIRSKGVKHEYRGGSNSESNNIDRFARTTVQMAWMRNQRMNYESRGAEGYYVLRGSNWDCPECDSHVGFHPIDDTENYPIFHPACCCWTIPVFRNE